MSDLKKEKSNFMLTGKVAPLANSLKPAALNKKGTWHTVNTTFGVDIDGKGNVIYARLFGGHSSTGQPIKCRPRNYDPENFALVDVPLTDRLEQSIIDTVAHSDILTTDISGTKRQFLSMVDFVDHLREHLVEGMEVSVVGNVEYTTPDVFNMDKVYRNYNVRGVYINPIVKKTNEETGEETEGLLKEHGTQLKQTYLLTSDSLPSSWKKDLKDNKEVILSAFVPEYINTIKDAHTKEYVKYQKVIAIPQAIIARLDRTQINLLKNLDGVFKVKGDDAIRKIHLFIEINEGYETATGEIEVTKELQDLIDAKILTLEEVKNQTTVRGQRTRELIISNIIVEKDNDGIVVQPWDDDIYEYSVLQVPPLKSDDDIEFNTISKNKAQTKEAPKVNEVFSEFEVDDENDVLKGLFDGV